MKLDSQNNPKGSHVSHEFTVLSNGAKEFRLHEDFKLKMLTSLRVRF